MWLLRMKILQIQQISCLELSFKSQVPKIKFHCCFWINLDFATVQFPLFNRAKLVTFCMEKPPILHGQLLDPQLHRPRGRCCWDMPCYGSIDGTAPTMEVNMTGNEGYQQQTISGCSRWICYGDMMHKQQIIVC